MSPNGRGAVAISASVAVFILNDALVKLATETMPTLQAIGMRGVFATLWCALAVAATGAWRQVYGLVHPSVVVRGVLEAAAAILYLVALAHIPFAIASAVNMSTPLFLTLLAVLLLKEDVRWRRWTAIGVGFAGVLMVIQPQPGDLNAWTWLVLAAAFCGALRDVLGRSVPAHVPTLVVSLASALTVALAGCIWAVFEGWQPMSAYGTGLLLASSLLLAMGYQLLMVALRSGAEFSVLASMRYASVVWALALGYAVWGDVPNGLALAGIAVVVASGLYILRRQRLRAAGAPNE